MTERRSRMFHLDQDYPIDRRNPIIGCLHHCYGDGCWAYRMANRIRNTNPKTRYDEGFFKPKLIESELQKPFKANTVIFISSMGDMWGSFIPSNWILRVLDHCQKFPQTIFFYETKNPARYFEFLDFIPKNAILSSTIETNREYKLSNAPTVKERYEAMRSLNWPKKHISIEPIVDFDLDIMVQWMKDIKPMIVSCGYDNYGCGLPEPSLKKTWELINELLKFTKFEKKTLREGK